ncbi:hypothetical protein DFH09DRAFT_1134058 [Mycena vulgaris]|nr:hypothetical protein DFH09DRAFT_1134058 [Mycena vulgaris]
MIDVASTTRDVLTKPCGISPSCHTIQGNEHLDERSSSPKTISCDNDPEPRFVGVILSPEIQAKNEGSELPPAVLNFALHISQDHDTEGADAEPSSPAKKGKLHAKLRSMSELEGGKRPRHRHSSPSVNGFLGGCPRTETVKSWNGHTSAILQSHRMRSISTEGPKAQTNSAKPSVIGTLKGLDSYRREEKENIPPPRRVPFSLHHV